MALTATAIVAARRPATKPGLATFFDLVLDEKRGRLYGSDNLSGRLGVLSLADLSTIGTVDLGQASKPTGVTLSPDGGEIAIALNGSGHITLVDPERLVVTGKLHPTVTSGENQPWDVLYAQTGRLYSTGNPGSGGFDYIHVFDTSTRVEVGKSSDIVRAAPRLAFAADGALFVGESIFSPQQGYRYATQGDTPVQVARGPHGPVAIPDLAVRADGSAVYTAGGQVWSGNLKSQVGAFTAKGSQIEFVAATERLFICQEASVAQVEATGNYNVVELHPVSATPRVARANAAGTILYVSTDAGLDVIQLSAAAR
jgi:DNA-binding beta-propeller fold protein YncE